MREIPRYDFVLTELQVRVRKMGRNRMMALKGEDVRRVGSTEDFGKQPEGVCIPYSNIGLSCLDTALE